MNRKIEVVPYNPDWPRLFAEEAARIQHALGDNCIALHHIGSTSIPGLAAKPVIDMLPVVKDIDTVDLATEAMQRLGYEAKGEFGILFRRYFQKGGNLRSHHVHVFQEGNDEIQRHLAFRDWVRTHSHDAVAYGALKQHLAKQFPNDIHAYCTGKEAFVAEIDRKAGSTGRRIVHALTEREWNLAKRMGCTKKDRSDENLAHLILYSGSECVAYAQVSLSPLQVLSIHCDTVATVEDKKWLSDQCERWVSR